jgi:glycosyltransferase involved in cell wall biosynthesis
MDSNAPLEIQVVMPAYNEADCVEAVIMEIYRELAPHVRFEFLVCEDGSRDGTREILHALSRKVPIRLVLGDQKKGYSRAVIDGLKASTADYVLCLESDGQYSPHDFWEFYEGREDYDISTGWRKPRRDTFARRLMSACFGCLYSLLFHSPLHDPSCAFMLIKRRVIDATAGDVGLLMEGFQREFIAIALARGFHVREIPLHHRPRQSGGTKAFPLVRIPRIATSNIWGLLRLWWRLRVSPSAARRKALPEAASHSAVGMHHVG